MRSKLQETTDVCEDVKDVENDLSVIMRIGIKKNMVKKRRLKIM